MARIGIDLEEEWRPVVGYEGHYEISSLGRVRSLARTLPHRQYGTRRWPAKLRKLYVDEDGRVSVKLHNAEGSRTVRVHRLVAEAFIGPGPDGTEICHNNGNASDNRPDNLRWDTRPENIRDSVKHGTNHWANKEQCPRGHKIADPNLVASALRRGKRDCLACNRTRSYLQKHPDLRDDFQAISGRYYDSIRKVN